MRSKGFKNQKRINLKNQSKIIKDQQIFNKSAKLYIAGKYNEALEVLEKQKITTNSARVLGLKGSIYRKLGELDKSLSLYNNSLSLDRNQHDILHNKSGLLLELNLIDEAIACSNEAIRIKSTVRYKGRLGICFLLAQNYADAIKLGKEMIKEDPKTSKGYIVLAGGALGQKRYAIAEKYYKMVFDKEKNPSDTDQFDSLMGLYGCYWEQGMYKDAENILLLLLKFNEQFSKHQISGLFERNAKMQESNGDKDMAIIWYEKSLSIDEENFQAASNYLRILNDTLKIDKFIEKWEGLASKINSENLYYGLSYAYETKKEWNKAEIYLQKAVDLAITKKPSNIKNLIKLNSQIDNKKIINKRTKGKKRIFIVGMPRCGSTLCETILCLNEKAIDLGEVRYIQDSLDTDKFSASKSLEERYLLQARMIKKVKNLDKLFTIDKNLYNYSRIPLILENMPQAKIIHCHRNPLDNILSMLKANLTTGNEYTRSVEDSAKALIAKDTIMNNLCMEYQRNIFSLQYEKLCTNPEETIKRIISWLGWDWDEKYLSPHLANRNTNTASISQIRSPISSKSVFGWRKYETMLQPAKIILESSNLYPNLDTTDLSEYLNSKSY